jgi:membrane protease YdiL (CAAX protease family)
MPAAARDPRPLVIALVALIVAAVAGRLVTSTPTPFGLTGGATLTWVGYLVVWIPLAAGIAVAATLVAKGSGSDGVGRLWGLRFHPLDLFWGFAAGCLARAADAFVNGAVYGDTGLHPSLLLGGQPSTASLVVAVVAPVIVAPLLEEVFFRGLLVRSLREVVGDGERWSGVGSRVLVVVATAVLFALLHVVAGSTGATAAEVTFVGTFVFGLFAGALTVATGRIGAAVVAHIVFNGVAVLLTWPG